MLITLLGGTLICFVSDNIGSIVEKNGFLSSIKDFLFFMVPFNFASLAVIYSSTASNLSDAVHDASFTYISYKRRKKVSDGSISRKWFLSLLLGYVSSIGIFIIIYTVSLPYVLRLSSKIIYDIPYFSTFGLLLFSLFCIIFLLMQIMHCTFLILYYLCYRFPQEEQEPEAVIE